MKKIGVLTSGGDAPGMNAAIRSIVRTALSEGMEVVGINRGYEGLLTNDVRNMDVMSVSNISARGGTVLFSARCDEMRTEAGRQTIYENAKKLGLDAMIVIGGDGTMAGGDLLSKMGLNVIGIPATIDLDLACTDYTIGFDTAVNTGMEAIGKIVDTGLSHERVSVIEVMGRDCGYLALWCAVASGADDALVPEIPDVDIDNVIARIKDSRERGKLHNIIVVAEGVVGSVVGAQELVDKIQAETGITSRLTVLGHVQRGGAPTALDRLHATKMGAYAVELVQQEAKSRVVVFKEGRYQHLDITEALAVKRPFDQKLYEKIRTLAL